MISRQQNDFYHHSLSGSDYDLLKRTRNSVMFAKLPLNKYRFDQIVMHCMPLQIHVIPLSKIGLSHEPLQNFEAALLRISVNANLQIKGFELSIIDTHYNNFLFKLYLIISYNLPISRKPDKRNKLYWFLYLQCWELYHYEKNFEFLEESCEGLAVLVLQVDCYISHTKHRPGRLESMRPAHYQKVASQPSEKREVIH